MKHLLKMSDLTPDEVAHILDVADELKAQQKDGGTEPLLKGKSVALMFSKNSTRTRTSFEVGVYQLGGLGNYMNAATELQSGRGEPLKDTARVLGRYYDCVVWRTYRQSDLEEFAEFTGVPVINGLTDYAHPCQVLADLMTIRERRGALAGQKLCFVGDGSNMANSLIVGGLLAGMLSSSSADSTAAEKNSDGTVTVRYKLPYAYVFIENVDKYIESYDAANPDAPMTYDYTSLKETIPWMEIIFYLGMLGCTGFLLFSMMRGGVGGGGGIMNVGKAKVKDEHENKKTATFADVAGEDEEKEELKNACLWEVSDGLGFGREEHVLAGNDVEEIVFPHTLKEIGRYIFNGCGNQRKLEFSDSLMQIGCGAFTGCHALEKLTVHMR